MLAREGDEKLSGTAKAERQPRFGGSQSRRPEADARRRKQRATSAGRFARFMTHASRRSAKGFSRPAGQAGLRRAGAPALMDEPSNAGSQPAGTGKLLLILSAALFPLGLALAWAAQRDSDTANTSAASSRPRSRAGRRGDRKPDRAQCAGAQHCRQRRLPTDRADACVAGAALAGTGAGDRQRFTLRSPTATGSAPPGT